MKKALVVFAAVLSMTSAFAQSAAPASAPAAASAPMREQHVEQRITYLHSALKITPQQESQWNAFADVMRSNGQTMAQLYEQRKADTNRTALDDMKQYAQITQAHAEGMKKLVDAFEPLYNSFSPDQKKLADQTFHERQASRRHRSGKAPQSQQSPQPSKAQ